MRVVSYKKIILFVFIILFSFLISLVIKKLVSPPENSILINNEWVLTKYDNTFIDKISNTFVFKFNKTNLLKKGNYKITTKFSVDKRVQSPSIIFPQQPDNGFRVYIDDNYISEVGDLDRGRGNTWKGSGIFKIPFLLEPGEHKIEIILYGIDQLSLASTPYINNPREEALKYSFITILNKNISFFMMGLTTLMGFLFLSLTIINKNENLNQTILGISFLCWTLFLMDFVTIDNTIISYLNFKKIVTISFYIGFVLNFIVIYRILYDQVRKRVVIIFLIVVTILLLLLIIPKDLYSFRIYSRIARFIYYLLFIPIIMNPKVLYNNNRSINLISVGIVGSAFFAIRYLILDTLGLPYLALRHIGLYLYLTFVFIFFIIDYFERNRRVLEESLRADHYYNKSVIDPLTNINNRNVLHYINFHEINFSLFICDLDDFKNINDKYGHNVGDDVLIRIATIIKETIRESDYAIRIGGDEFVFILINCPFEKTKMIAENIWAKISSSIIIHGKEKITFRCSGGGTLSQSEEDYKTVLKRADKNLYEIKESGKGSFKFSL